MYLGFPYLLAAVQKNVAMVVLGMAFLVMLALTFKDKPLTGSYTMDFISQRKILILPENGLYFLMGILTAIRLDKNYPLYPSRILVGRLLILMAGAGFLGRWILYLDRPLIGDPRYYFAINFLYTALCLYFSMLLVNTLVVKGFFGPNNSR